MPFPVLLLLIATMLPLAGCCVLAVMGKRLGTPLVGYVATFFVALSFLCSGWALLRWIAPESSYHGMAYGKRVAAVSLTWKWLPIGAGLGQDHPGFLDVGIYVDSLTVGLFVTIPLAAMLVFIFAGRSLRRDPRVSRFFACLSLACFATLAAVLSGSLLQLFILFELIGFATLFLIGFRFERAAATRAAMRIFIANRVADVGLLLGLGILVCRVGNLSLPDLWMLLGDAASGRSIVLSGGATISTGLLTAMGIALFLGAAGRCAQFPLHVWAADVAESVAPAAAMTLAIAPCVAAIYFLARIFPLLTPSARLFVAIVGAVTLIMAALIAMVQSDIKRVLAFVSVSQLGHMVLGLGVGSWVGAMFHLFAYIFFQTLLWLGAGSVIRGARGTTDLMRYGGLVRKMPVTAIAFAVALSAICGIGWGSVGLSGYYSRGLIVRNAGAFAALATSLGRSNAYWMLFIVPVVGAGLTAWCMTRCWMLAFCGEPRDRRLFDHAREVPTLYWPLVVLAIMTALAGNWLGIHDMLDSSMFEARQAATAQAAGPEPVSSASSPVFASAWPAEERADEDSSAAGPATTEALGAQVRANQLAGKWLWVSVTAGMVGAILLYLRGLSVASRLGSVPPIRWFRIWLVERMYFDEFYESLIVTSAAAAARLIGWWDWMLVNGAVHLADVMMLWVKSALLRTRGRGLVPMDNECREQEARPRAAPILPPVHQGRE